MGPPPFGDGNPLDSAQALAVGAASMGPPPFGDGNRTGPGRYCGPSSTLQWGHRLSAMETNRSCRLRCGSSRRFNGATAFRRWKPGPSWRGMTSSRCFNGATAFRRWKPAGQLKHPMMLTACFNGATAFRRWKHAAVGNLPAGIALLQWGHRLSAMETTQARQCFLPHLRASMGPPPFGDGNAIVNIISGTGDG